MENDVENEKKAASLIASCFVCLTLISQALM